MPSGEQDCTVPLLEGEAGGRTWSRLGVSAGFLGGLSSRPSSSRLFSLQVPVPPRIFLSMVYKLEGPSDVGVALELTTGSVGSCHIGGISALNGEGLGSAPASPCRSLPSQSSSGKRSLAGCLGGGGCRGSAGRPSLCSCWSLGSRPGQRGSSLSRHLWPLLGSIACCVGWTCAPAGLRAGPPAGHGTERGGVRGRGRSQES